jgi:hypothetical protein
MGGRYSSPATKRDFTFSNFFIFQGLVSVVAAAMAPLTAVDLNSAATVVFGTKCSRFRVGIVGYVTSFAVAASPANSHLMTLLTGVDGLERINQTQTPVARTASPHTITPHLFGRP